MLRNDPDRLKGDKGGHIGPSLWISVACYVLLSVLMTWPLTLHLGSQVPTIDSDVFNVYWGNWWVRHALGQGQNPYFTDYLIYPEGFDLISFAFSPFLALLWIPLSWILEPLAAYNLVVLATIVLCCVAMDQLVRYLTGNAWAAMVAAITFAFAPSLFAERLPHLNLAAVFWIPWAMLLLTRLLRQARMRDAILLALVVVFAFLTRLQVGVLVVLFGGIYFVGLALVEGRRWHRLALRRLVLAALVCLVLLSPLLVHAYRSLQQPGAASLTRGDADLTQTDLLAYFVPPPQNPLLGSWTAAIYSRFTVNQGYWAYLGILPLLLALYASVSRPRQALPWLLAGVCTFLLALGPFLRFNGETFPTIRLPYSWAENLFSTIGLNWPNRFNLALMVSVSALTGIACAQLFGRVSGRYKGALPLGLISLLILADYLVVPLPTILPPPHSAFYDQMASDPEPYAIVDLPLTRADGEIHRYFQTIHHKPIVGGWDHRVPDSAFDFMAANPLLAEWLFEDKTGTPLDLDGALRQLAAANVRYIVIHKPQIKAVPEGLRALLTTLNPVFQDWSILVLPVAPVSSEGYHVVHWFGQDLGLVQPTAYLHLPWDGRPPLLSFHLCFWQGKEESAADAYRLTVADPDGRVVYDETAPMPTSSRGLACDVVQPEVPSPVPVGEYELGMTPLLEGQPLGTYTTTQPVHALETRRGIQFPAMGSPSPAAFEAPMELLGYNLVGGDGFIWTDLFLRATDKHQGSYFLSAQLVDVETGQEVLHSDDIIGDHMWRRGDLYQERRILWLNDVAPGRYNLRIVLQGPPAPRWDVAPSPGQMVTVEVPLQVLPHSEKGLTGVETGTILAYTLAQ